MSPQTAFALTETPQRVDQVWVAALPPGIAEDLFGMPTGSPVTFFVKPGEISAVMNLALQTEEARQREPGWILAMPPDIAAASGSAEGSLMVVYAKAGMLRVEVLPPPSPRIEAAVDRVLAGYGEAFAEMKRLGD